MLMLILRYTAWPRPATCTLLGPSQPIKHACTGCARMSFVVCVSLFSGWRVMRFRKDLKRVAQVLGSNIVSGACAPLITGHGCRQQNVFQHSLGDPQSDGTHLGCLHLPWRQAEAARSRSRQCSTRVSPRRSPRTRTARTNQHRHQRCGDCSSKPK